MPKCAKCGADLHGLRCPACGERATAALKMVNKQLQKYMYPLFAGLVGIIIADKSYPPLDENPLMILALCLFFVPVLLHIVLTVRKRLPDSFDWLRLVYLYSGSASAVLAVVLGVNGLADRAPARLVQTSITRKYATSGRGGTSYHIVVSSWRPGEDHERLCVNRNTYHAMFIGEQVVVEVHRGVFAVPWYGRITPQ